MSPCGETTSISAEGTFRHLPPPPPTALRPLHIHAGPQSHFLLCTPPHAATTLAALPPAVHPRVLPEETGSLLSHRPGAGSVLSQPRPAREQPSCTAARAPACPRRTESSHDTIRRIPPAKSVFWPTVGMRRLLPGKEPTRTLCRSSCISTSHDNQDPSCLLLRSLQDSERGTTVAI